MRFSVAFVALAGVMAIGASGAIGTVTAQDKSQWDGVYGQEQAKRGEGLYSQYCSSCHGQDLTGDEVRRGRAEEDRGPDQLVRLAEAPGGGAAEDPLTHPWGPSALLPIPVSPASPPDLGLHGPLMHVLPLLDRPGAQLVDEFH